MESIQPLLDLIAKQNEQIIELSKVIADLKAQPAPEPVIPTPVRQYPLYVPESEEDARALHAAGEITKEQLEGVLQELEFFNNDITVPTPGI